MPVMLILCGAVLAYRIRLFKILSPRHFFSTLTDAETKKGVSPFKAMSTALAGTLGVGNIAGVATAISAGGPGAVFWMWMGALFSMSVKYGEVVLAVKYRHFSNERGFFGGAMYTIRDGLRKKLGSRGAKFLGGIFALLCIINSLIMGNVIQSNSAAAALDGVPAEVIGISFGTLIIVVAIFGTSKITSYTFLLIIPLSIAYMIITSVIIIMNASLLPTILADIVKNAFSFSALAGGGAGFTIKEAVRYGITRGIFSNEAGCGTSPTAHASANTKSPHHQGCFGIFEVIADTLVLCSMTAFVILIGKERYPQTLGSLDGVPLTLKAISDLLSPFAANLISISIVLFAVATVIAQIYYGDVATGYFTKRKSALWLFIIFSAVSAYIGSVINVDLIWPWADLTIGIMTCINVVVLFLMQGEISVVAKENDKALNKD